MNESFYFSFTFYTLSCYSSLGEIDSRDGEVVRVGLVDGIEEGLVVGCWQRWVDEELSFCSAIYSSAYSFLFSFLIWAIF